MRNKIRCIFFLGLLYVSSCEQSNKPVYAPPEPIIYGTDQLFEAPALNGPFLVASKQFYWVDQEREEPHTVANEDNRELLVRVFYPAEQTDGLAQLPVYDFRRWPFWQDAGDPNNPRNLRRSNYQASYWPVFIEAPVNQTLGIYPLIIFSHGYGFSPEEHVVIAADLASRGFIVASINHPYGSSRAIFPDGRIIYAEALPAHNLGADLDLWSDDQIFVLNQLEQLNFDPNSLLFGKLDLNKIATTGHSYGGAAAFHSAFKDNRIGAAIDVDGTIFNSQNKIINIPFMLLQSGPIDDYSIFDQVENDGYGVTFNNLIKHHSFADYVLFWRWDFPQQTPFGPLDGELAFKTTTDVMSQFLFKYFHGDTAEQLDDPNQISNLISVRYFP